MSERTGQSEDVAGETRGTNTPQEIMEATYRALCEQGYAALTMQDIADESAKSKAALHYHYDTKDELLLSFLEYLFESFVQRYGDPEGEHAVERLVQFVDDILCRSDVETDEAVQTAFLEIKAQAPYDPAYREQLEAVDRFVRDRVRDIVVDGIEEGIIDESVDPEDTAAFVATLIDGVNTRRISIGETDGGTRRAFLTYVREHVVAPDADVVVDGEASPPSPRRAGGEPAGESGSARRDGHRPDERDDHPSSERDDHGADERNDHRSDERTEADP